MKQGRSLKGAKAERAAKKKRAKRRRRAFVLFAELVVLAILIGTGYTMSQYRKLQSQQYKEEDIVKNEGAGQKQYTTIALFGGDSREGELGSGTHADTIMIASIDKETKEIKIVSVYRDLLTKQMNQQMNKANYAYFSGGPLEAINMLNRNFDLDIEDYVTVDFKAMADAVDLLGGIEVDVTDAEAEELNHYIDETASVTGKTAKHIQGGTQILDGAQTVTYARIRKNVGDDYMRTERQRGVLQKLVEKVKSTDLKTLNEIIDKVFPQVSTSFKLKEIIGLAAGVLEYELEGTSGYPFEKTDVMHQKFGSVVVPLDAEKNLNQLHSFLYPKETYVMSDEARSIVNEIESQLDNTP